MLFPLAVLGGGRGLALSHPSRLPRESSSIFLAWLRTPAAAEASNKHAHCILLVFLHFRVCSSAHHRSVWLLSARIKVRRCFPPAPYHISFSQPQRLRGPLQLFPSPEMPLGYSSKVFRRSCCQMIVCNSGEGTGMKCRWRILPSPLQVPLDCYPVMSMFIGRAKACGEK